MTKHLSPRELGRLAGCFCSKEEITKLAHHFNFTAPQIGCMFYDNHSLHEVACEMLHKWNCKSYFEREIMLKALEKAAKELDLKYLLEQVRKLQKQEI